MDPGTTMLDKIWKLHAVEDMGSGHSLIAVDRCYLNDLGGGTALRLLSDAKLPANDPNRTFCFTDHTVTSKEDRTEDETVISRAFTGRFRKHCREFGIPLIGLDNPRQGIEHVAAPEMGLTLPGMTVACGDSHTMTHGALGALAFGNGSSEMYHCIATGTMIVKKPMAMRITIKGKYDSSRVEAMDVALYLLSKFGTRVGSGFAIEFSGEVVSRMDIEDRMTLCNLAQEMGAELAFTAPDEKTYAYIADREYAPAGEMFNALVSHCRTLTSDADAVFDKEISVDVTGLRPQISWGTTPALVTSLGGSVPSAGDVPDLDADSFNEALTYLGLEPGRPLAGTKIDMIFIGSCATGRLGSLKRAADALRGKRIAPYVTAWVVPGSEPVKREAERLGLDVVFKEAGCFWGAPGCSLCCGANGETVPPFLRCVSSANRNFIGRQGPNARTHLAGPVTAILAAVAGAIPDDIGGGPL
ncbi:MAG: 3-isopropylmalate dehydratase large subunit [Oscillospiraceae bacterium]|nr:3-isopropylmalate dehydratase large subunit [Oscillospiraceae bacterium]